MILLWTQTQSSNGNLTLPNSPVLFFSNSLALPFHFLVHLPYFISTYSPSSSAVNYLHLYFVANINGIFLFFSQEIFSLRQEIDGLQARCLKLAPCLHFLRQEVGELQVRHVQSPLLFALWNRNNNRNSVKKNRLCFLWTLWDNSYGRDREGLIPVWVKDQEVTYFPSLRQGRHFTCPGRPPIVDLRAGILGKNLWVHFGKGSSKVGQVWKKETDNWPKVNKDPEELPSVSGLTAC